VTGTDSNLIVIIDSIVCGAQATGCWSSRRIQSRQPWELLRIGDYLLGEVWRSHFVRNLYRLRDHDHLKYR
jgi:hypothetical protein